MKTLEAIRVARFHISQLGIFGSYLRGEQTDASDIDILVDFDGTVNVFDLIDIEDYLAEKLGIKSRYHN